MRFRESMMMNSLTIAELITVLDQIAPFALAEAWDHSGLRLGSAGAAVHRAAFSLDPSPEAVRMAREMGCDVLVTHHPLLFKGAADLVCDRIDTITAQTAFALGVNIIACHTNFDSAVRGVNTLLAELAGMESVEPLIPCEDPRGFGMGAVGCIDQDDCVRVCDRLANRWRLSGYRLVGPDRTIGKVALCGGAGGSLWKNALEKKAQLYATADMSYHECLEAVAAGLTLMLCDHGEMEEMPLAALAEEVSSRGIPVEFLPRKNFVHSSGSWRSRGDYVQH